MEKNITELDLFNLKPIVEENPSVKEVPAMSQPVQETDLNVNDRIESQKVTKDYIPDPSDEVNSKPDYEKPQNNPQDFVEDEHMNNNNDEVFRDNEEPELRNLEETNRSKAPIVLMNTQDDIDEKRRDKLKKKKSFKQTFKHLCSYIGLIVAVIVYSVVGAIVFTFIEAYNEARNCQIGLGEENTNIYKLQSQLILYVQQNVTANSNDKSKDNITVATETIDQWLIDFKDSLMSNQGNYGFSGQDCTNGLKWSFTGALLFTVTIITTIGYGQLPPKTDEGRIFCVCYALIGIPLFLMCLSNISSTLGYLFRYSYVKVCCRFYYYRKKKNKAKMLEKNKTISTTSSKVAILNEMEAPDTSFDKHSQKSKIADAHEDEEFKNEENVDDIDIDHVSVPLTVTMIVITIYIIIGAGIFSAFEGWSLVQSAYFAYVTLSTIGFGDFVPGQGNGPLIGLELIIGAFYILIGLAVLAMCFDLMQAEIKAKFKWIGTKLGIVEKDEDDDEEDPEEDRKKSNNNKDNEKQEDEPKKLPFKPEEKPHFYPSSQLPRNQGVYVPPLPVGFDQPESSGQNSSR